MIQVISKEFNLKELIEFAIPSIIMMVFLSLYTIVDGFFVSYFVGTDALSAINITYPLSSIFIAVGVMFATGGSSVVATQMGEGKKEQANKSFSLIAIVLLGVSVIGVACSFIFMERILIGLGADQTLIILCREYISILLLFAPMSVFQMLFQNFFVTAGRPGIGLILTIIAGLSNIVLDFVFIGLLDMGIAGAAYATAVGYCIPAIGGLLFFARNKTGLHFVFPIWKSSVILKSCTNGSSEMVTNLSTSITTLIFNRLMMSYIGVDGVAAITVIMYCQFLMTAIFMGFSIGVAPVISYHYGAVNKNYLKKLKGMCWRFILITSIFIFFIAICSTDLIAGLFSDDASPVYPLICRGMLLFSFSFLFAGVNIFASAMYTAISDGKTSVLISLSRTFLFIIIGIVVMTKLFAIDGLWLSIPFAEIVTVIFVVYIYKKPLVGSRI